MGELLYGRHNPDPDPDPDHGPDPDPDPNSGPNPNPDLNPNTNPDPNPNPNQVLYGSVLEWVCQERKGWRKFENFKILREGLKPRTKYVFLGDNGKSEKDFEAASRIVDAFPKELQARSLASSPALPSYHPSTPFPRSCRRVTGPQPLPLSHCSSATASSATGPQPLPPQLLPASYCRSSFPSAATTTQLLPHRRCSNKCCRLSCAVRLLARRLRRDRTMANVGLPAAAELTHGLPGSYRLPMARGALAPALIHGGPLGSGASRV